MNTKREYNNRWIQAVVLVMALGLMLLPLFLSDSTLGGMMDWMHSTGNIWLTLLVAGLWTMLVGGLAMLVIWLLGADR